MALVLTQSLTEMSTRNCPGGKGRLARKADNLSAVCELSRKCGSLDVSHPYEPPRPNTGIALYIYIHKYIKMYIIFAKSTTLLWMKYICVANPTLGTL
jgi:hypothetical protein